MNAANGQMLHLVPRPRGIWTLGGVVETIAFVRTLDPEYADYMMRMYANYLPGGRYAP